MQRSAACVVAAAAVAAVRSLPVDVALSLAQLKHTFRLPQALRALVQLLQLCGTSKSPKISTSRLTDGEQIIITIALRILGHPLPWSRLTSPIFI